MQSRRGFIGVALAGLCQRARAQEPERFVIYFRWNSAVLRPVMEPLVLAAAQSAKLRRSHRVEVTGYTDTSLSDDESRDISYRMAQVVADTLLRHGVAGETIVSRGLGEVNLVKATADGVIEPYNRRVEIVIR